jgi:hypothetical protein
MTYRSNMYIEVECALDHVNLQATDEQIEEIAKSIETGMENHNLGAPDYPRTILESEHEQALLASKQNISEIRKEHELKISNLQSYIWKLESRIGDLERQLK